MRFAGAVKRQLASHRKISALTEDSLGLNEYPAIYAIESSCTISCKLQVLSLVLSYRHMRRAMDQNISGLKNRIREESKLKWRIERLSIVLQCHLALPLCHA